MKKLINELKDSLQTMILFALAFIVVGQCIPEVYFRYIDKTDYYQIELPIQVDRAVYQPCQTVNLKVHRNSLVDVDATAIVELTLLEEDKKTEIETKTFNLVLNKGEEVINFPIVLPCKIPIGKYYYNGILKYKVQNVTKTKNFYTSKFYVFYDK